jgi:F-type H+-transporting ATPase subunit gamma
MANRRVLVKRRDAARNIRKITRTMQLIATARFQAAYNRASAGKPYTEKLAKLAEDLTRATVGAGGANGAGSTDHPLKQAAENCDRAALMVITSTRGLCGGYNANVLRVAGEEFDRNGEADLATDIYMVGKKGLSYYDFMKRPIHSRLTEFGEAPRFDQVEPLANELMKRFVDGEIGAVSVAYMKFISTGKQRAVVEQILPLMKTPSPDEEAAEASSGGTQYEFSPAPEELLEELLPATVRVKLFQYFSDAAVSEQVARMVAMKAATDAAEDMIKRLTQKYNRARQTHITMELLDIIGGADALS